MSKSMERQADHWRERHDEQKARAEAAERELANREGELVQVAYDRDAAVRERDEMTIRLSKMEARAEQDATLTAVREKLTPHNVYPWVREALAIIDGEGESLADTVAELYEEGKPLSDPSPDLGERLIRLTRRLGRLFAVGPARARSGASGDDHPAPAPATDGEGEK